eukprot:TRINITY_DN3048_c0_g1_i1.p1 TRINITY_DN3048_c0_g1~~TRINITY_DN3048_c0_g1_i1.p1  ORF type:complete len:525 (+),score=106.69 TRINITY_DN3048_c0_g1_i1:54-1628(+)
MSDKVEHTIDVNLYTTSPACKDMFYRLLPSVVTSSPTEPIIQVNGITIKLQIFLDTNPRQTPVFGWKAASQPSHKPLSNNLLTIFIYTPDNPEALQMIKGFSTQAGQGKVSGLIIANLSGCKKFVVPKLQVERIAETIGLGLMEVGGNTPDNVTTDRITRLIMDIINSPKSSNKVSSPKIITLATGWRKANVQNERSSPPAILSPHQDRRATNAEASKSKSNSAICPPTITSRPSRTKTGPNSRPIKEPSIDPEAEQKANELQPGLYKTLSERNLTISLNQDGYSISLVIQDDGDTGAAKTKKSTENVNDQEKMMRRMTLMVTVNPIELKKLLEEVRLDEEDCDEEDVQNVDPNHPEYLERIKMRERRKRKRQEENRLKEIERRSREGGKISKETMAGKLKWNWDDDSSDDENTQSTWSPQPARPKCRLEKMFDEPGDEGSDENESDTFKKNTSEADANSTGTWKKVRNTELLGKLLKESDTGNNVIEKEELKKSLDERERGHDTLSRKGWVLGGNRAGRGNGR